MENHSHVHLNSNGTLIGEMIINDGLSSNKSETIWIYSESLGVNLTVDGNWTQTTLSYHDATSRANTQQSGEMVMEFIYYYTPVLVSFGCVTNVVTCLVLMTSALHRFSSSHYMTSLCVANTLYLILLFLKWLTMNGYNVYNRPTVCQLMDLLSNASSFLSLWLAVAFAVDRYIAISWPAEASRMCRSLRARVVIVLFTLVALIAYLNTSITVGVVFINGQPRCHPLPLAFRKIKGLLLLDLVANHMIPFAVIIILMTLVGRTVYFERRGLSLGHQGDPSQIRLATLVYFVIFLLSHLPFDIYNTVYIINKTYKYTRFSRASLFYGGYVTEYLSHTGMALNFIILITCYPLFRQYFCQYFIKVKDVVIKYCKYREGVESPESIALKNEIQSRYSNGGALVPVIKVH